MNKILILSALALIGCQEIADPTVDNTKISSPSLRKLPIGISYGSYAGLSSFQRISSTSSSSLISYSLGVGMSIPGSWTGLYSSSSWQNFSSYTYSSLEISSSSWSSARISSSSNTISSSSQPSKTFTLRATDLNSWGYKDLGTGNYAIVGVDSDVGAGGSSYLTNTSGSIIGYCPPTMSGCANNWAMQASYFNGAIGLNFFVKDWVSVSGSQMKRGYAGMWVFPNVDPAASGANWFDKAQKIGLTPLSTISLFLMYQNGAKLKIKLVGSGMSATDPNSAAPEYIYTGQGVNEWVIIPVSSFARPTTARNQMFNLADVSGIGLERSVESSMGQTVFPSVEPDSTRLFFRSIILSALQ